MTSEDSKVMRALQQKVRELQEIVDGLQDGGEPAISITAMRDYRTCVIDIDPHVDGGIEIAVLEWNEVQKRYVEKSSKILSRAETVAALMQIAPDAMRNVTA